MMKISLIVAAADNGVIGFNNQMPWHLPPDLKHFKALTLGKPMIMGRKTFASLPGVLPGRPHIVISRQAQDMQPPCYSSDSLAQALITAEQLCSSADMGNPEAEKEAMIIGGGEIYRLALPKADRVYLTRVHLNPEGDTWFPELSPDQWRETARDTHREPLAHTFITYERKR